AALGRTEWLDLAAETFAAAKEKFGRDGRLIHAARGDVAGDQGFALDYAAMIHGALGLVAAGVGDRQALLGDAALWCETLARHHRAPSGGLYWTADDAPALIVRPDTPSDEAVPNANGLMVKNLATLWALTGDDRYEAEARQILRAHARAAAGNVFSCTSLFLGFDQLQNFATVTAKGAPELLDAVRRSGHPAAIAVDVPPKNSPAETVSLPDGTAVVCRGGTCSLPIDNPDDIVAELWKPL
ncbi:MAG: hypothetical protein AAGB11_10195, partial [Pseudomonadota bacterium]